MVIVANGPLDASPATPARVEQKVRNYLAEALDISFRKELGGIDVAQICILVQSRFELIHSCSN